MALTPQYAATPKLAVATLSAANANRDGTGTIVAALTAGANGTRVRAIHIKATGTTTAGMVRLYAHDGTTAHLVREVPVSAITPSATLESFGSSITEDTAPDFLPLTLPSGWSLRASTERAEAFRVTVEGADL